MQLFFSSSYKQLRGRGKEGWAGSCQVNISQQVLACRVLRPVKLKCLFLKFFDRFPPMKPTKKKKKPSVLLIKPSIAAKREREERDMGEELLWFSDRMTRDVTGRQSRCPMLNKTAQRATCWCWNRLWDIDAGTTCLTWRTLQCQVFVLHFNQHFNMPWSGGGKKKTTNESWFNKKAKEW